ncbi:hypothetical protein AAC387_Pa11g0506 [Persea americana]
MASGKRPKPQPPTALPNANSPRRVWEVLGYCVSRGSSWSLSIVARSRRCRFVFIFIMIVSLKEGRRYVNAPPSSLLLLNATLSIPTTPSDSERYAFHSNFPPFLFPDKNFQVEINVAAASNLIYPQDRSTKYSLLSPALTVS